MTAKVVVPRDQAHRDVEEAVDHYAREAGADIALGFVEALEAAYRWIGGHSGTGSPHHAHDSTCRAYGIDRLGGSPI